MKKIKLTTKEALSLIAPRQLQLPKYSSQIINLANQNAQGTRPKVVGQMSELIQALGNGSIEEWEENYTKTHPTAIDEATDKIYNMIELFRISINQIDRSIVQSWVKDLVIDKTYIGLHYQEAIIKKIAKDKNTTYRLSTPSEESQGIDGYIGDDSVSVKPITYKSMNLLPESITVKIIYYEKRKDGISIEYNF
ncbi:MAG: MjaI family restriction endonuclease [Rikenellaceae bacterium]